MIETIHGLPDNAIGFTAKGKVTGEDYETTLVPAIEAVLQEHGKARLLYHLGSEYDGYAGTAIWADAKIGLRHPTSWERIAIVTDTDWIRGATKAFGFAIPGHVRAFVCADYEDAVAWISE